MAHADRSTVPDATQAAGINPNPTRKTKMPNNITLTQDQIDAVKAIIDATIGQSVWCDDGERTDLDDNIIAAGAELDAMRAPEVEEVCDQCGEPGEISTREAREDGIWAFCVTCRPPVEEFREPLTDITGCDY